MAGFIHEEPPATRGLAAGRELEELVMELLFVMVLIVALAGLVVAARRRGKARELAQREEALAPVRTLAFEDVTAFGEALAKLDVEIAGQVLDEGATADYQRALDTYEAAKLAGDSMTEPDDVRKVTAIIEDGRYAIECVRARVEGKPLPTRRPPCFFDPRHGPSVADVPFVPSDGVERRVPACALDTERVRAGAEPDSRKVLVGGSRVPYWDGGRAYQPYALGYFGLDALSWLFVGSFVFDGYGDAGTGDSGSDSSDGGGDGFAFDGGGDF